MRQLIPAFAIALSLSIAGCSGDNAPQSPTAPTANTPTVTTTPEPSLGVSTIASVPDGAGVQFNTNFQFTVGGSFPTGTEFVWNFGDGSSTTSSTPVVSRTYGQAGVFQVSVTARRGGDTASAAKSVNVRSLIGNWVGKITGFTSFPMERPVAMTGFEMLVANQTLNGNSLMLSGRWADDAGCRETRAENFRQKIVPSAAATVTFGVNGLSCASGDFYLTGTADATFDHVEGSCNVIGNNPNCRFTMTRQ